MQSGRDSAENSDQRAVCWPDLSPGPGKKRLWACLHPKLKLLKQRHPDWIRRPTDELQHSHAGYPGETIYRTSQFSQPIFRTTIRNQGIMIHCTPTLHCIKKIEKTMCLKHREQMNEQRTCNGKNRMFNGSSFLADWTGVSEYDYHTSPSVPGDAERQNLQRPLQVWKHEHDHHSQSEYEVRRWAWPLPADIVIINVMCSYCCATNREPPPPPFPPTNLWSICSDTLPAMQLEATALLPPVSMTIYKGSSESRVMADFVTIGDPVALVINLSRQGTYGMLVKDCVVKDGVDMGGSQPLIDSKG